MKEPDVDMSLECVDVGEGGIGDARGWVAVMQQFAYIISTIADNVEPMARDSGQLTGMLAHPGAHTRIPLDRAGQPEDAAHGEASAFTLRHSANSGGFCAQNSAGTP